MKHDGPNLRAADWTVRTASMDECHELVTAHHYARGGPNTATFRHGLYPVSGGHVRGIAWWLPPTRPAGAATWPDDPHAVLSLTRLVIAPDVPRNAASFLLAASVKRVRRDPRWACLVTYADERMGHTGAIYLAAGWEYVGLTSAEAAWIDPTSGRQVARKRASHTRTNAEMLALGYKMVGRFRKHKYRLVLA